jgi:hypothetical protein
MMALSKEERSRINRENALKGVEKQRKRLKNPKYREWYGKQLSNGIKNNKSAVEARRQNMIKLNKSDKQRAKASKHLKEKWKEEGWSDKSHAWQEDREKLMAATQAGVEAMKKSETYISKAEKELKKWLHELGYKTNTNRFLVEGKNRFYDIRIDKFLIEIDGPWHFKEFYSRFKDPNHDSSVDEAKNKFAVDNGYVLLRVSNWGDKLEDQKAIIKAYLDRIEEIKPGVYYEGIKYEN